MKSLIQGFLGRIGYRLQRLQPDFPPLDGCSFSVLDLALERLNSQRAGRVRFLQIGANDGIHQDPCYPWLCVHPWQGVLVEPMPALAAQLRNLHAHHSGIAIEQAVVADTPGTMTFYHLAADVPLPPEASAISSLESEFVTTAMRNFVAAGLRADGLRVANFAVPALTIEQLMERHHLDGLDFLQIDAEGYDARILASIDFKQIRPVVVAYEHANLSRAELMHCRELLKAEGYHFGSWLGDTVAIQVNNLPAADLQRAVKVTEAA